MLREVIAADNARDLDRVLGFYTDDVVWLPPARAPLRGIANIRASYETMYATFAPALTISVDDTRVERGIASVTGGTGGVLHPRAGGGDTAIDDRFEAKLRCVGQRWRIEEMSWAPRPR